MSADYYMTAWFYDRSGESQKIIVRNLTLDRLKDGFWVKWDQDVSQYEYDAMFGNIFVPAARLIEIRRGIY